MASPIVAAVYFWDIRDNPASWREGTGLFFDDGSPKPAYYQLQPYLMDAKERKGSLISRIRSLSHYKEFMLIK
jgi:hypothetical protein